MSKRLERIIAQATERERLFPTVDYPGGVSHLYHTYKDFVISFVNTTSYIPSASTIQQVHEWYINKPKFYSSILTFPQGSEDYYAYDSLTFVDKVENTIFFATPELYIKPAIHEGFKVFPVESRELNSAKELFPTPFNKVLEETYLLKVAVENEKQVLSDYQKSLSAPSEQIEKHLKALDAIYVQITKHLKEVSLRASRRLAQKKAEGKRDSLSRTQRYLSLLKEAKP